MEDKQAQELEAKVKGSKQLLSNGCACLSSKLCIWYFELSSKHYYLYSSVWIFSLFFSDSFHVQLFNNLFLVYPTRRSLYDWICQTFGTSVCNCIIIQNSICSTFQSWDVDWRTSETTRDSSIHGIVVSNSIFLGMGWVHIQLWSL